MRLKTFGALALVARGEGSKSVRIPRIPLAVLAVLAAEGGAGITRDRLMGLFWPDRPQQKARALLAQAFYKAQDALGVKVVIEGAAALQLDPECLPSDVAEFEAALDGKDLAAAVAVYAGPFLEGFRFGGLPELARWANARRDVLAAHYLDALLALARSAVREGDGQRALAFATRAVEAEPLKSTAVIALMEALARSGDRNAAILEERRYATRVREALGVEPDTMVTEYAKRLREGIPKPDEREPHHEPPMPERVPDPPSIAVLPFRNIGGDPAQEYFADGMTREIIECLMRRERLRVISSTSSFVYKDHTDDVRTIGRRLRVAHLLEGGVQRDAERLKVNVRLVRIEDNAILWSDTFNRELGDAIEIQEEIAKEIGKVLDVKLSGIGVLPRMGAGIEAYDHFLRGRFHWDSRAHDRMPTALACYQRAMALDQDFAAASAYAAEALAGMTFYGVVAPTESMPKTRALATHALKLDRFLAEARTALGVARAIHDHDWAGSEADFTTAMREIPLYVTAHLWWALFCLVPTGRLEMALEDLRAARRTDPINWSLSSVTGLVCYFAGRYQEAIDHAGRALAVEEAYPLAHFVLGRSRTQLGEFGPALASLARADDLTGGFSQVASAIGVAQARAGDRAAAQAQLARIREQERDRYVSGCDAAFVHAALGEVEGALQGFERGYAQRAIDMLWVWRDPSVAPAIKTHPRMAALRARMGIPA